MSPQQATAEVFMTALKAMPHDEQNSFLNVLLKDKNFREDIIDLIIAKERKPEKKQPFRSFLKTLPRRIRT